MVVDEDLPAWQEEQDSTPPGQLVASKKESDAEQHCVVKSKHG